jgi:hypothetical protein
MRKIIFGLVLPLLIGIAFQTGSARYCKWRVEAALLDSDCPKTRIVCQVGV